MSTDYAAVCMKCRVEFHLGVHMGGGWHFAHGSKDAAGRAWVGKRIEEHAWPPCDLRVMGSDVVPDGFRYLDEDNTP